MTDMKRVWAVLMMLVQTVLCAGQHVIWKIGESDNSTGEFALAPDGYEDFIRADFGFEDR